MRTVVLYPYDSELRPGLLGADFVSDSSKEDFTLRVEADGAQGLMKYVRDFLKLKATEGKT
jgi:hypothetical protein